MRKVNLRQFQRYFYSEIKDLPVTVVKFKNKNDKVGTPILVIYPIKNEPSFLESLLGQ